MVAQREHAQAEGILKYMLDKGRASRKQIGWLIGYVKRLRAESETSSHQPAT